MALVETGLELRVSFEAAFFCAMDADSGAAYPPQAQTVDEDFDMDL